MAQLPNLFVPGAQKSATTSLFRLLERHPEIYCTPGRKEPDFFSRDGRFDRGTDYYVNEYYSSYRGQRYVLDASVSYMPLPFVPERIAKTVDTDPRFIFVLRHPVRRIVSAFTHFRVRPQGEIVRELSDIFPLELNTVNLDELLEFEQREVRRGLAAGSLIGRNDTFSQYGFPFRYAYVSCYARHIENYLRYFPKENLLFLTFEEVTQDQAAAMRKIASFLSIDPQLLIPDDSVHAVTKQYKNEWVRKILAPIKKRIKPLVPAPIVQPLAKAERALLKKHPRRELPESTFQALTRIFAPEIDRTGALTGLDLSHWKA